MGQLINTGKELIRICPKDARKLEYSANDGKSWNSRFINNSCGDFHDLIDNGDELLATTSKGLYYSKSEGKSWSKRS